MAIVGFGVVLQQTPLPVTGDPPSAVTLPPVVAVVWVIIVTADVDTVGVFSVVNVSPGP